MKEITEYNVWPVSVVVCVWEGGGRSIGGWCQGQDPGSKSVVWG